MDIILDEMECRVLGCLIEKEMTTPEYYPLSLNSLMLACNQKSNRNPMMDMSEEMVANTLDSLRNKHLVWERRTAGARVLKYEHNLPGLAQFSMAEAAILCELLVRGPQTPGELRNRASRMNAFKDIFEVEETLKILYTRTEGPFVTELPRSKGTKETRYAHLFSGPVAATSSNQLTETQSAPVQVPSQISAPAPEKNPVTQPSAPSDSRLSALEDEVKALRIELEAVKKQIDEMSKQADSSQQQV
jgi:uncharacterized protein